MISPALSWEQIGPKSRSSHHQNTKKDGASGPSHQVHAQEMWLVRSQGNTFLHTVTLSKAPRIPQILDTTDRKTGTWRKNTTEEQTTEDTEVAQTQMETQESQENTTEGDEKLEESCKKALFPQKENGKQQKNLQDFLQGFQTLECGGGGFIVRLNSMRLHTSSPAIQKHPKVSTSQHCDGESTCQSPRCKKKEKLWTKLGARPTMVGLYRRGSTQFCGKTLLDPDRLGTPTVYMDDRSWTTHDLDLLVQTLQAWYQIILAQWQEWVRLLAKRKSPSGVKRIAISFYLHFFTSNTSPISDWVSFCVRLMHSGSITWTPSW